MMRPVRIAIAVMVLAGALCCRARAAPKTAEGERTTSDLPSAVGPGASVFNVKQYGAAADGRTKDTAAIQKAIDVCAASGGGLVYLAPGTYLSGTVVLKSNVTLHLESGATLLGSTDLDDYDPRHLVYARGARNVGIAGRGRIDGQGETFWEPRAPLPDAAKPWYERDRFWHKPKARPGRMVCFVQCRDVHIRDVRLENSPGWTVHLLACDSAIVQGVTIRNPLYGPNTDGIDIDACREVTVSGCIISTSDDAIVLKNTNTDGLARQSRNIAVTNCILTTTCNGFKMGTETLEGFENVLFSDSVIAHHPKAPHWPAISGVAIETVDGGHVRNVNVSNIAMQNVRAPIFIRLGARLRRKDPEVGPGTLRDVSISHVTALGALLPSVIAGLPDHPVEGVRLTDIRVRTAGGGAEDVAARTVPHKPKNYPEATMFGDLPAYGFYCRHVEGLRMRDVDVMPEQGDARPAVVCEGVRNLVIDSLTAAPPSGVWPVLRFIQTRDATVRGWRTPTDVATFLRAEGDRTARILLMGNDFSRVKNVVDFSDGAAAASVSRSANHPGK